VAGEARFVKTTKEKKNMKSVNKVILIGRLGRDPEMKYTGSGTPFCRFSIATDEGWTDKATGEKQERTEWHNIVVWDRLAEICSEYLRKGRLVYIEGALQTREWDDQEGNKRKTTEIRGRDMVLLSSPQGENAAAGQAPRRAGASAVGATPAPESTGTTITDDDIPF
jgi:single-strand DNA-binding protein